MKTKEIEKEIVFCQLLVYNKTYNIGDWWYTMINKRYEYLLQKLNDSLEKLNTLEFENENFDIEILKWFIEHVNKNYYIHESKINPEKHDSEYNKKPRSHVFWVEFGINIGSEFNEPHYAVVVKESKYTAIVVPLTSKKDKIPKWVQDDDAIIPIGKVSGFENGNTECYACVSLIRSVSKRRLSSKVDGKFVKLKLLPEQMDKIDSVINNRFTKLDT